MARPKKQDTRAYLQTLEKPQLINMLLEHRAQLVADIEQINREIGTTATTGDDVFKLVMARAHVNMLIDQSDGLLNGTAGQVANLDKDRDD